MTPLLEVWNVRERIEKVLVGNRPIAIWPAQHASPSLGHRTTALNLGSEHGGMKVIIGTRGYVEQGDRFEARLLR